MSSSAVRESWCDWVHLNEHKYVKKQLVSRRATSVGDWWWDQTCVKRLEQTFSKGHHWEILQFLWLTSNTESPFVTHTYFPAATRGLLLLLLWQTTGTRFIAVYNLNEVITGIGERMFSCWAAACLTFSVSPYQIHIVFSPPPPPPPSLLLLLFQPVCSSSSLGYSAVRCQSMLMRWQHMAHSLFKISYQTASKPLHSPTVPSGSHHTHLLQRSAEHTWQRSLTSTSAPEFELHMNPPMGRQEETVLIYN